MNGAAGTGLTASAARSDAALEMCLILVTRQGADGEELLLGMKRRGFGEGRVVAPGGKVDAGESAVEAARRELFEETGLQASDLRACGVLDFRFPHDERTRAMRAHVFTTATYDGEAADSDEIAVAWTPVTALPLDRMWADARHWLPRALGGTLSAATFTYAADGRTLESFTVEGRADDDGADADDGAPLPS